MSTFSGLPGLKLNGNANDLRLQRPPARHLCSKERFNRWRAALLPISGKRKSSSPVRWRSGVSVFMKRVMLIREISVRPLGTLRIKFTQWMTRGQPKMHQTVWINLYRMRADDVRTSEVWQRRTTLEPAVYRACNVAVARYTMPEQYASKILCSCKSYLLISSLFLFTVQQM